MFVQQEICRRYGADFAAIPETHKVGISTTVLSGLLPLNGLRHSPEGDTSGWYIWAGEELSESADFFQPLHIGHLDSWCPEVIKYLGLPPGWRFLLAGEHVDVWFDKALLNI
jgi:hypothetical protein